MADFQSAVTMREAASVPERVVTPRPLTPGWSVGPYFPFGVVVAPSDLALAASAAASSLFISSAASSLHQSVAWSYYDNTLHSHIVQVG